jgi:hypothetical protein
MKTLIVLFGLIATSSYAKSVNLLVNATVATCAKNSQCEYIDSSHELSVPMGTLGDTGMDIGIADLNFKSPIQKFNFKMIASIHETEKDMELMFAAFDEEYRLNKIILKMAVPAVSEEAFKLESPVVTNAKGTTSKLILEVLRIETLK